MGNKRYNLKIVIVGSEQRKWTLPRESLARNLIKHIMEHQPNALFISGDCPKGGVDKWVREIAKQLNKSFKSFPANKNTWYWYKKRNIQMAEEGDVVIDIEPEGFTSGGTWTLNYAKTKGKNVILVEV